MIRFLLLATLIGCACPFVRAQSDSTETVPFITVEVRPQFPGGDEALSRYFVKKIKYPAKARDMGIEGKVFVEFVIEKDGSVTHVRTARSVDPLLDREAERVIRSMPKWSPGSQLGKPVKVKFTIPINFNLK